MEILDNLGWYILLYFIIGGMLMGPRLLDLPELLAEFIELVCRTFRRKE